MFPVIRGCARTRNTVDSGNLVRQSLIANDGVLGARPSWPLLSGFWVKLPVRCWTDSTAIADR